MIKNFLRGKFANFYLSSHATVFQTLNGLFTVVMGAIKKIFKNFFSNPPSKKIFFEIFLKIFFGQSIALKKLGTVPKGLTDWFNSR